MRATVTAVSRSLFTILLTLLVSRQYFHCLGLILVLKPDVSVLVSVLKATNLVLVLHLPSRITGYMLKISRFIKHLATACQCGNSVNYCC